MLEHYNAGAVVSTIDTIWESVAVFPAASVAVQVTMVSPTGNTSGASLEIETTPTASVALAPITFTILFSADVASLITSSGAIIVGGTESVTVIF